MFSPAGVVAYAYGPQASGCVPYWMVAATGGTPAAGTRVSLPGTQVPSAALPTDSPTRVTPGVTAYPAPAAAYHDLLKRTVQLNELLYPSVVPLPGTLTADSTSPTSAARLSAVPHQQQAGLRSRQQQGQGSPRSPPESLGYYLGQDRRSPGMSPVRAQGHPLSPSAVQSKDLKFGIDRILHPSRKNNEISNDDNRRENVPSNSSLVRRPIAKNPVHPSPVLSPQRPAAFCPPATGIYRSPEAGMGGSLSPGRGCPRPGGMMAPHPLSQHGHHQPHQFMAQSIAAAASYHHHFRPEYTGHISMMGPSNQVSGHQDQTHPKRKRSWSRAVFSHLQRKGLEKRFEVQKYVTKPDRRQLAAMLGLTDAQVKVWFQNRRMKWRHAEEAKRKKEEEDKQNNKTNNSKSTESNTNKKGVTSELDLDLSMKSDDDNDSEDEDHHGFENSFEEDGHNSELIVDELSSDDDDDMDGDGERVAKGHRDNKQINPLCDYTVKDELR